MNQLPSFIVLQNEVLNSPLVGYAIVVAVVLLLMQALRVFALPAIATKERSFRTVLSHKVSQISFVTLSVSALHIARILTLPPSDLAQILYAAFLVVWTWEIGVLIMGLVENAVLSLLRISKAEEDSVGRLVLIFTRILIWGIGILLILSNLGFNINSVLAGLGVGGIALALAMQAVLSDLISTITILADKPFHVGDTISTDAFSGQVERIGIRSTRINSLDGEKIVMPNSKLVSALIKNVSQGKGMRSELKFTISHETQSSVVSDIPALVSSILQGYSEINREYSHVSMAEITSSGYVFEVGFLVLTHDKKEQSLVQHKVLSDIAEKLKQEGLKFI